MSQLQIKVEDTESTDLDKKIFKCTGTDLPTVDYVLVFNKNDHANDEKKRDIREKFESALSFQGILLEEYVDPCNVDVVYVRVHTPFKRLAEEAEDMKLEMPLEECQIYDDPDSCLELIEQKYFVTDEEDDFVSAPFFLSRFYMYKGYRDEATFFRSSLRIYLTHHILIHTDIRELTVDSPEPLLSKKALPHLLMTEVYTDAFALHEPSIEDPMFPKYDRKIQKMNPDIPVKPSVEQYEFGVDHRTALDKTWVKILKYQPMWKIRNYFGEKIAFYFAWTGHLITWLWFPTFFGLICFAYGLYLRIKVGIERNSESSTTNTTSTTTASIADTVESMLDIIKEAFDNVITPFFALTICIWGTILTETWKRTRHRLAYEWDVNNFSDIEPDRPQFVGTTRRLDPITKEEDWYYPMKKQFIKFCASFGILVIMICIVFISVAGVILYRVFVTVQYCGSISTTDCLLINVVASSILNAVSILLLGKFYDWLAVKLTEWENHRTQTSYDDALIIKLFAFQFANSYSSLIYIAFFRGTQSSNGIFGLGAQYTDTCGSNGNCMTMLSFQVLILMLMKPMPKLLIDIVLPWALKILRRMKKRCCGKNKVKNKSTSLKTPQDVQSQIEFESKKPALKDFTIGEYMEKVIQYGYLMLFASSFPLAPLFALLTNVFDRLVDAKRLLWMYRRPCPQIVSSIGMWEIIVEFLNIVGVITNAFIIAFTSSWGRQYDVTTRLIIVLGVEHAVFAVKFFTMAIIPDVPGYVQLSIRREKYQVQQILESGDLKASSISERRRAQNRLRSSLARPILNSKNVVDQATFLAKLPLSIYDSSEHQQHPQPPISLDENRQSTDKGLYNKTLYFENFELQPNLNQEGPTSAPSNRLPPLNTTGKRIHDEEKDNLRGPNSNENVKKRRKKKAASNPENMPIISASNGNTADNEHVV